MGNRAEIDERGNFIGDVRVQVGRRDTFVPAGPGPVNRADLAALGGLAGAIAPAERADYAAAYAPAETIQERTSAKDRAVGFLMRTSGLLALEFFLGLAVAAMVAITGSVSVAQFAVIVMGVFAVCAVPTYLALNHQDLSHSASGVERYKVKEAGKTVRHDRTEQRIERIEAMRLHARLLGLGDGGQRD